MFFWTQNHTRTAMSDCVKTTTEVSTEDERPSEGSWHEDISKVVFREMLPWNKRMKNVYCFNTKRRLRVRVEICACKFWHSELLHRYNKNVDFSNEVSPSGVTREFKLRVQTSNDKHRATRQILHWNAVKCEWTCCFKTSMYNYSFDMWKKIWNQEFKRKFCKESSALLFAVDRKREA